MGAQQEPSSSDLEQRTQRSAVGAERGLQTDFKALPGMTHREAAKRLSVSAPKVLGFLESGRLKGSQLSRTKWKISGPDLATFARNHSDLLK